ncbi:MAG: hypothetical protein ALAOOOJD_04721 [bacterium]|nr:hypothetical protein [bacterium]
MRRQPRDAAQHQQSHAGDEERTENRMPGFVDARIAAKEQIDQRQFFFPHLALQRFRGGINQQNAGAGEQTAKPAAEQNPLPFVPTLNGNHAPHRQADGDTNPDGALELQFIVAQTPEECDQNQNTEGYPNENREYQHHHFADLFKF